ncbi:MAG: hypothetical protein AB7G06_08140 [Bdellovibrionales bacterium]
MVALVPHLKMSVMTRAVQAFDKASAVIVAIVWGGAVVLMFLGYLGVHSAIGAREQLAAAEASTPGTPVISLDRLDAPSVAILVDKLQKRYGSVLTIKSDKGSNKITIMAKDASAFSSWLTAVTYLDIIRPDVSWTIEDMCIGAKCKDGIMTGTFSAQTTKFQLPQPVD